jgi:abequosyltransferase
MIKRQLPDKPLSSPPLLSICIPTYNRGSFLPDLLSSIEQEIDRLPHDLALQGVTVAISDNASSDDTAERVAYFTERLTINYVRQIKNIGPDRNFMAAVAIAPGRFCWLMGSDDIIEIGAIERVLRAAVQWDVAGFSLNYHRRSFDLSQTSDVRPPVSYRTDTIVEGRSAIYQAFAGHWGYLSGHVVRRDLWEAVCNTGEPLHYLNAYVHVFIMGRMTEQKPRWGYLHAICVGWRGRNDSFISGDHVKRMMIDVVGYRQITERLFGKKSNTTRAVMNSVCGTHILVHYRIAKVFYHSGASLREAARTLFREYWQYPAFWKRLFPWILVPAPLLHGLWICYQRTRYRIDPDFPIHPQARKQH